MTYKIDTILKVVNKNQKAEIDCLKKLVGIPTCYIKNHDMKPMINQLTEEFEKRNYKVQAYQTAGPPVLVAELKQNRKKTLLFYNHYDVQPEEPLEEWNTPPYQLTLKDNRLYGRGISDDKGPLVANI